MSSEDDTIGRVTNTSPFPPLDATRLQYSAWPQVEIVDDIDSTNAELLRRAGGSSDKSRSIRDTGTDQVLIAESQSAGQGRAGRQWESLPQSQLLISVLLHPHVSVERLPLIPLITGLVIAETLESFGLRAAVKWPNDVLVTDPEEGELKIAGILTQVASISPQPVVVVGFGVNVWQCPPQVPEGIGTSMHEQGWNGDRTQVAQRILARLHERYNQWLATGGGTQFLAEYRSRCSTLGRELHVQLPTNDTLVGQGIDLSPTGALVVRTADGQQHSVDAGDVVHVRPQESS